MIDSKIIFRVAGYVGLVSIGIAGVSFAIASKFTPVSIGRSPIAANSLPIASPVSPHNPGIVFFGDVMLDRNVRTRMATAHSLEYPFALIKQSPELFDSQDIRVANLEGPVTATHQSPIKSIDFAFDPSVVQMLHDVGIAAVSQANNHTLDQGRLGAKQSHDVLQDGGIIAFGDQTRSDVESSTGFITLDSGVVALVGLNITDTPINRTEVQKTIESARAKAQKVIVVIHWGAEYKVSPNKTQIELAHWFIDQGVDAVIGGHPHWMESVEMYKGKFIAYSLGNFIFDQDWSVETRYGLALRLTNNSVSLYPIHIIASQPVLTVGKERQDRLDRLAVFSDPALSDAIRRGEIPL